MIAERSVFTVEPNQRIGVARVAKTRRLHLADKDGVIPGIVRGNESAIDVRDTLIEDGRAGCIGMMSNIGKRIGGLGNLLGKSLCQIFLMFAKNIECEMFGACNKRVRQIVFIDTH